MEKVFLPIGSVVHLENSTALVMIAGYLPVSQSHVNHVWDYLGFKFPIGYVDDETVYCFDHKQIETVYAYGYRDIEHDLFASKLPEMQELALQEISTDNADSNGSGNEEI